jgi:hypothetical protein
MRGERCGRLRDAVCDHGDPGRFGTRGVFLRGLLSVFTVHLFVKSV